MTGVKGPIGLSTALAGILLLVACGSSRGVQPVVPAPASTASADLLCERGHARLGDRDYAGAADAFDRCRDADPTRAYAYYYAGMAYRELGRLDLMSQRFERFIELAPDAPERPRVQAILRSLEG